MAEKLLTGGSFKAPDWKGPKATPAASAAPASAPATAQHADTEMPDAENCPADPLLDEEAVQTAAAASLADPMDLTAAAVRPSNSTPNAAVDAAQMPHLATARPSQQQVEEHAPPQQPQQQQQPAPAAVRRPGAVIRQPGWQTPPQTDLQSPHQPQPPAKPQCVQPPPTPLPPPPQPVTHVNDLPDDLLQRIFSMLPFRKRRRLGKVCCHWRALCAGPSQMWHQVDLKCREDLQEVPLPRGARACSLQPVYRDRRMCGPGSMDTLHPGSAAEPEPVPMVVQAGRHLTWLAPRLTAVRELALVDWPTDTEAALLPAVAAALRDCASLRGLRLGCHLLPSGCGPLQWLPAGLRTLHIDCMFGAQPGMQPGLSAALARLAHLQELRLGLQMQAGAPEIGFPLGVLACSGLVRLRIEAIAGRLCSTLPDDISRLMRLRSLQLPDCGASQLPEAMAQLTALSELDLRSGAAPFTPVALPPGLAALQDLLSLSVTADRHLPVFATLSSLTRLEVNGLESVAEAQRIATDFWQLHAPAGAPLGARAITRSQPPFRGTLVHRHADEAEDGAGQSRQDSAGSDGDSLAPVDGSSGRLPAAAAAPAAATAPSLAAAAAAAGSATAAAAAAATRDAGLPTSDCSGGTCAGSRRWRIEWRKPSGARAAAQYVPPPGATLRAMLLSVAGG